MLPHLNEWFATKPQPVFEHPTLGTFRAENGLWISEIPQGENTLLLSLAGDEAAPIQSLTSAATDLLTRFAEVKTVALDFLTSQEEAPSREDFACYDLELLHEEFPNHFRSALFSLGILVAFGELSSRMGHLSFSLVTIERQDTHHSQ